MTDHAIFILGDSTSMTIGAERQAYPFLMAGEKRWPENTVIVNCSQPGITSADACAFFFRHKKDYASVKAVFIHLGTCDGILTEIPKGRYTPWRQFVHAVKRKLGLKKARSRLRNRLLPFEWSGDYDVSLETSEDPKDYEYNLRRVIRRCRKASIPVILFRPRSHVLFPPGVAKGNFIFYRYLGLEDKISGRLNVPEPRFAKALELQESRRFAEAMEAYRDMLLNSGPLSHHPEFNLILVNNFAVCAAESGDARQAEYLLKLLLKEGPVRKEIVLYNLAQLSKKEGDLDKYSKYLSESFESDASLYRMRSPYLEALDRLAAEFPSAVRVVDLHAFLDDELYVDHCHPLKEGQKKIADEALKALADAGIAGNAQASIRNILYNPEHGLGNESEFYAYFRAYAPFTRAEIAEKRGLPNPPEDFRKAYEYHLRHPAFTSVADILKFGPEHPSDVGRFPEFFLIRHVIPYLRAHEAQAELRGRFSPDVGVLRSAEDLARALPPDVVSLVAGGEPPFDAAFEAVRLPAMLDKIREVLVAHLRSGHQIFVRMKSTLLWFFRETLRYGAHSRVSMRYDRTTLEYAAEALAVAGWVDWKSGGKRAEEIRGLIAALEETVRIHDRHCAHFSMKRPSSGSLAEYDAQLAALANRLQGSQGTEQNDLRHRNIGLLSR